MKKTLIASAVALATFASTGAMAAEMNLPKVYGNIQLAMYQQNTTSSIANTPDANDSDYALVDNGSTVGFSHEHEIMPGLTGFLKAEFEFNADRQKGAGNGLNRGDQAYIGVKGDFGTVKVGSYDTIYNDAITDTVADVFEYYGVAEQTPTNEGDTFTYYTPSFSGLSAAVAVQVNGEKDQSKLAADGKARNAAMAVLTYKMDQTEINLGWDSADNTSQSSSFGLAITQGLGDLNVGFSYQNQADRKDAGGNIVSFGSDIYSLRGTMTMGANQFIAVYQYVDYSSDNATKDNNIVTLQALHNLSDNMYVYVEGQWADSSARNNNTTADVESTGMALGATYVF